MTVTATIRRAEQRDRAELARLCFASKAYWGYDAAFMESVRDQLTPSESYVAEGRIFLAEAPNGTMLGFYGFVYEDEQLWLYDMFIAPEVIRTGIGRMLWNHAVDFARTTGERAFSIESDPNAEEFYLKMGARRDGERIAAGSGRILPVLKYELVGR
ncbi:MAG: GNAT family N-acetyltransferase [Candidatus Eremiobacteraeota bacterium]|nr:GNAT family N-acetyltransferase [Candidatus Eremiobacteraeota bacterium]